ncbi:hypothetical protein NDU88_010092 [Pleurodeles waltl]|uniref:Uncharacterized protein n=1 Tax=Pleurodeles waltl TaxID=8319 RepID=A0AAV7RX56_PLEWA|nr:hypothetical protein NDU88_010092 [Pleurodeles waltl]
MVNLEVPLEHLLVSKLLVPLDYEPLGKLVLSCKDLLKDRQAVVRPPRSSVKPGHPRRPGALPPPEPDAAAAPEPGESRSVAAEPDNEGERHRGVTTPAGRLGEGHFVLHYDPGGYETARTAVEVGPLPKQRSGLHITTVVEPQQSVR